MNGFCRACNSHIGKTWERYLPLDPAVRHVIERLSPTVLALATALSAKLG